METNKQIIKMKSFLKNI